MIPRKRIAIIAFYNSEKEILLQDRRGIKKPHKEWGFFGGEIEEDETPQQAIVREIKEELECDLKIFNYVGCFEIPGSDKLREYHLFTAKCPPASELHVMEGAGSGLFTCKAAKKLDMYPSDYQILDILERVL